MNWGTKILIVYVAFVLGIVFMAEVQVYMGVMIIMVAMACGVKTLEPVWVCMGSVAMATQANF